MMIPTMECDRCSSEGYRMDCPTCEGAGYIYRPPLTPEQVAALPDWTRVLVQRHGERFVRLGTVYTDPVNGLRGAAFGRLDHADRVWLADDDGDGYDA